jgi:hypothetical protein
MIHKRNKILSLVWEKNCAILKKLLKIFLIYIIVKNNRTHKTMQTMYEKFSHIKSWLVLGNCLKNPILLMDRITQCTGVSYSLDYFDLFKQ